MRCQRCDRNHEATFRVYSEVLDLAVCSACAIQAVNLIGPRPSDLKIGPLTVHRETNAVVMPTAKH